MLTDDNVEAISGESEFRTHTTWNFPVPDLHKMINKVPPVAAARISTPSISIKSKQEQASASEIIEGWNAAVSADQRLAHLAGPQHLARRGKFAGWRPVEVQENEAGRHLQGG